MSRLAIFLAAAFSCISALLFAVSGGGPRGAGQVELACEPVDLGELDQGDKAPFRLLVRNPTPDRAAIVGLAASCGCTALDDVKGRSVGPGETLAIGGVLDSGQRSGPFRTHAVLSYRLGSQARERQLMLTVGASARPWLRSSPERLEFRPDARDADSLSATVEIGSDRLESFRIFQAEASAPWIRVELLQKAFTNLDGIQVPARLRVSIAPDFFAQGEIPRLRKPESIRIETSVDSARNLVIPVAFAGDEKKE